MRASLLVDVYNFFDLSVPQETVRDLLILIEDSATPETEHLDVRLYGGWFEGGILTRHASQLVSDLSSIRFPMQHPKRVGVLPGRIALADGSLALASRAYGGTLRQRSGIKRVALLDGQLPRSCAEPQNCAVQALKKLARRDSTCPTTTCSVRNHEAFKHKEQKMVDTLLVLDTLHLAAASPAARVVVASDDLDLVPALDVAAASGCDVTLIARQAPDLNGLQEMFPTKAWRGTARG